MPGIFLSARPTSIAQLAQEKPCIAKTTRSVRGIIHHEDNRKICRFAWRDPNRDEHAASDALLGVFTETTGEAARTEGRFVRRRVQPSDDGTRIPRNRRDDRLEDPTKAARRGRRRRDHPT